MEDYLNPQEEDFRDRDLDLAVAVDRRRRGL
jgi:hypothetical protein